MRALLSRASPKDVIGIRCATKQSLSKRAKDIDGGGGKKKSGQNVDVVVERGGGGGEKNVLTTGRRRSTMVASCAFAIGFLPNVPPFKGGTLNTKAAGGWGDCAPVCDALKGGFSAQQKMQEEMLRQSLATINSSESGGDGSEKEGAKKSDKVDFAPSEREKRKKNSMTRRQ